MRSQSYNGLGGAFCRWFSLNSGAVVERFPQLTHLNVYYVVEKIRPNGYCVWVHDWLVSHYITNTKLTRC